ncbi:hypothetical protein BIW11_04734 [Tropilaelaps mercedesae]|uniref:Uncharacterized protein n=1 Tax=Tropilaelaps mercedesae TaxID=418985 RepID=A0A1V9X1Y9_9ACAR|nr:hypothetical protein BIW11_04734 [Tropilaelaps mercedesae]
MDPRLRKWEILQLWLIIGKKQLRPDVSQQIIFGESSAQLNMKY